MRCLIRKSLVASLSADLVVAVVVVGLGVFARLVDRALILDEQRDRSHVQRVKVVDAIGQIAGNRDRLGMQLLLHVALGPNRADVLEVAGPRPEREPIENVQNSVLL